MTIMKEDIRKFADSHWFVSKEMDPRTVSYIKSVVEKLDNSGVMRDVDEGSIYLLATQFNSYIQASDLIMKEGVIIKTPHGLVPNPATTVQNKSFSAMQNIIKEYGLTAKSAEKIKSVAPKEELSPLQKFMQERNGGDEE